MGYFNSQDGWDPPPPSLPLFQALPFPLPHSWRHTEVPVSSCTITVGILGPKLKVDLSLPSLHPFRHQKRLHLFLAKTTFTPPLARDASRHNASISCRQFENFPVFFFKYVQTTLKSARASAHIHDWHWQWIRLGICWGPETAVGAVGAHY